MTPTLRRYQVIVVEDADRVTERGADALLKSIEEPAAKTVWLLCAPTPTTWWSPSRPRCRGLELATPSTAAVAELLVRRDGVPPELAGFAARAAQGHIGRARMLARNEEVRTRRADLLRLPGRLHPLAECCTAAGLVEARSAAEASAATADLDAR